MASIWLGRIESARVLSKKRPGGVHGRAVVSRFFGRRIRAARNVKNFQPLGGVNATLPPVTLLRWRSTSAPSPSAASSRTARPPTPRRLPPDPGMRGVDDDEYRWMHDINSEEMLRHMERENRYSAAYLKPLRRRASELFRHMVDRQPEEDGGDRRSVPERLGRYLYYTRRDEGKGFPVYVRRPVEGTLDEEQVIFDLNEIEENGLPTGGGGGRWDGNEGGRQEPGLDQEMPGPAPGLGSMKLSPDQRMLACTIDMDGSDRFELVVFDLAAGDRGEGKVKERGGGDGSGRRQLGPAVALSEEAIWDDVVGVEWGSSWRRKPAPHEGRSDISDSEAHSYELFYTVPDELRRPWQVRRVNIHRRSRKSAHPADGGDELGGYLAAGGGSCGWGWRVDATSDSAVFEEKNDAFFVDVGRTKDHSFVVINVHSKTTSEIHLLPTSTSTSTTGWPTGASPAGVGQHRHPDEERTETVAVASAHGGGTGSGGGTSSGGGEGGEGLADDRSTCRPTLLRARRQGVEYYVDHAGDAFYVVTNSPPLGFEGDGRHGEGAAGAREYRLVRVQRPPGLREGASPSSSPSSSSTSSLNGIGDALWEAMPVPCETGRDDSTIQEMDLFERHCVLYESSTVSGCPRLRVVPLPASGESSCPASAPFVVSPPAVGGGGGGGGSNGDSGGRGTDGTYDDVGEYVERVGDVIGGGGAAAAAAAAAVAPSACTLRPGVNSWFEARTARFSLSSPLAPEDVYDLCLESGAVELLRRTEVPGSPAFDRRDYSCYTVRIASHDGEMVPLTIVHRRGIPLDGSNRLILHGYGAYGMSLPMDYHPGNACMLEQGWVLAFAHVRGGGERGKAWHSAGRGFNKWNSFWDFQACADHLVSVGFTSPSTMGARVNSAGGLLAGAMANFRPELFSAMVMKAPFLGVLCAMRDTSLPLTVHEFDEWGDPSSSEEAEAMIRSYCPYENVREQEYPAMLVTASVNDNRVNVWDPAKWVSRVRAANTGDAPVVLRVSDTDGHHGPDNTLDGLKDSAIEMSFFEKHLRAAGQKRDERHENSSGAVAPQQ